MTTILSQTPNCFISGLREQIYPRHVHSLIALISWAILATLVDFAYQSMLATSLMLEVDNKNLLC